MAKFNVGDKVRIVKRLPGNSSGWRKGWSEENGHHGCVGYVTEEYFGKFEGKSQICVNTVYDVSENYYGYFADEELELVTEEIPRSKFKVGDRVECIEDAGGGDVLAGDRGTVFWNPNHDNENYLQIKFDSSSKANGGYRFEDFKIIDEEEKPTAKFKVGDRVRVLDKPTTYSSEKFEGQEIVITKVIDYFGQLSDRTSHKSGRDLGYYHYKSKECSDVWEGDLEWVGYPIEVKEYEPIYCNGSNCRAERSYRIESPKANGIKRPSWKCKNCRIIKNNDTTHVNKEGENMDLLNKFKDALLGEPERSLMKYEIIDQRGNLTSQGKELYINWKFKQDLEAFQKDVLAVLIKADKKSKKDEE